MDITEERLLDLEAKNERLEAEVAALRSVARSASEQATAAATDLLNYSGRMAAVEADANLALRVVHEAEQARTFFTVRSRLRRSVRRLVRRMAAS